MTSGTLVRTGATAAVVAAVLGIVGDLYHVTFDRDESAAIFKVHGVLLIAALVLAVLALFAFALFHAERWGGLGTAAFWIALFGTVLVAGDIYHETIVTPSLVEVSPEFVDADPEGWHLFGVIVSFALFGLGWLLVGIGIARAGALTRAGAIVIAIGGVIGFTPLPGSYLILFVGLALVGNDLRGKQEAPGAAVP